MTWTVISTATTNVYTPVTEDIGSWLKVTATYNDGQGSDKSAQATSEFAVRDTPSTNVGPAFGTGPLTRSIVEGSTAGRNIGNPVTATDENAEDNDKLTYELSGTDVDSFDIDATNGQVKTKAPLVYATKRNYTVIATATDPSLESDTITVTINVTRSSTATVRREQREQRWKQWRRRRRLLHPADELETRHSLRGSQHYSQSGREHGAWRPEHRSTSHGHRR